MRQFSDNEYIKLFRRLVNWEWYTDVNTTKLFLHCLLMANWKEGQWRGIPYKKGQFFTSLSSLSKETGLTIKEVRTALKHLKSTNEVAIETTSRYTLISVVSFDKYQGEGHTDGQTRGKRGANKGQQNKNIKNNKNNKENIEEENAIFHHDPDDDEIPDDFWDNDEEE